MASLLASFNRNPIVRAEFHHQRFVIKNGRVGTIWIALAAALVIPALLMALIFTAAGLAALFYPAAQNIMPYADSPNELALGFGLLLTMMIAMYVVVTLITMALASNSISREKQNNTWDNLRLTDIGADNIVLGKWWASLRALNGDLVMVTVLRVGFVSLFVGSLAPALDVLEAAANGTITSLTFIRTGEYLPALPILIALTLLYGALDAGLTAALGIIAALPDDAAGSVVGTVAVAVRLIAIVAAGGWLWLSLNALRTDGIGAMVVLSLIGLAAGTALMFAALWWAKRLVN